MHLPTFLAVSPYFYVNRFGTMVQFSIIDYLPVFLISLLIGLFFRVRRTRVVFGLVLIWSSVAAMIGLLLLYLYGPISFRA